MPGPLSPYERDVLPFVRPFTDRLVATVDVATVDGLLDHGAGTGEVVCRLRAAGYSGPVVGLDISPAMIDRLQANIGGRPDTTVFGGDLRSFVDAMPDARFGLITSQLVLPFVKDPGREL